MKEMLSTYQNLTEDKETAQAIWRYITHSIEEVGRNDILQNPTVLDIGGGVGEFSKNLNSEGINCVSLDIKNLELNSGANQIVANANKMPFVDESFSIVHGRGIFDKKLYPNYHSYLLKEIARVLKTKGILSVYDATPPNNKDLEKYFKILNSDREYPTLWEKK
ncbi:hypothetical protein COX93_00215 [Candidatus Nomurabacteria bacterium CG_4_10_14_0_2_um_filter_30_12]|uniref:Methyltransferase type 11 domain-containing protein n=2 Tax=Candidatus Nomuraibacteriota TaxID=1752729 RepID=A0A2J0MHS7_9BACT|nr:MAG: hypothetical protein COU48_02905 [Candidatus Nomurabacteria bacterium CG10_big_fil_rev_8_21_14_0_10_03_31_7]PIZ87708.1 MAG: hypothetical protein COX93_00215 [Candidatus Nomurabacteria bacterium CG_4_10_14_0_2_um_filter_30_12]